MKKILIVEDEFIIAHHVKELLEKKEIGKCTITDTYQESMDYIKKELPDIALLDICLFDDRDAGIRLAHFIQEHYAIPFIFLSGYSDQDTLKHARLSRPATFITKPIVEKQLLAAIAMALSEEDLPKIKTASLKGRYLENIKEANFSRINLSKYELINKEIQFKEVTVIQAFNNIKRNTILFKFKQPGAYFIYGGTIENVMKILPPYFEQIHQSFIINTHYITAKKEGHFVTILDENIPIGAAFR